MEALLRAKILKLRGRGDHMFKQCLRLLFFQIFLVLGERLSDPYLRLFSEVFPGLLAFPVPWERPGSARAS